MVGTRVSNSPHESADAPSRPGRPVRQAAAVHASPGVETFRGSGGRAHAPGGGVNILIVEDDLLIALDIEMTLEEAGHNVVATATTASAAVDAAHQHEPDLVLMDLRLADGSWGGDAAREIRERLDVALVFLSGNLDPVTRERLMPLDPVAMLSKPFLPGQLLKAVAAVG